MITINVFWIIPVTTAGKSCLLTPHRNSGNLEPIKPLRLVIVDKKSILFTASSAKQPRFVKKKDLGVRRIPNFSALVSASLYGTLVFRERLSDVLQKV